MAGVDPERLPKLAEALAVLFYVLMFLAFVCALAGSAGSGFLLLVLGACAHVGRVGFEGAVNEQQGKGDANVDRRVRTASPTRHTPRSRLTLRGVASSPVAADLADLRTKLASKISASR
jgi:hypothetical protein